jgi:hypothetical protein
MFAVGHQKQFNPDDHSHRRRLIMFPHKATIAFLLSLIAAAGAPLEYSPVRDANPLKGFVPFSGDHGPDAIPHSMEFFYIPLNDLMDGPSSFTWNPLDARLDAIADRGHHSVFRVFLDYPKKPTGIPDFLLHGPDGIAGTKDDLAMRSYSEFGNEGVSLSPNYDDPSLRAALLNFIAALGKRYDGDPRIGFLQLGLLGFWGEWHTYPYNGSGGKPDWFAAASVQEEILTAFDHAFDRTPLLVREPKSPSFANHSIGYHDDSFAFSTLTPPNWHFHGKLDAFGETERWRTQPIGGEIRPENQPGMWENPGIVPDGQDFARCVKTTHASWMLAHGAFTNRLSRKARALACQQSLQLGYEFHIPNAAIKATSSNHPIVINTELRNTGVAPFYHDWPLELVVLDDANRAAHTSRTAWRLSGLLPGDPERRWTHTLPAEALNPGSYRLLLRVLNPLARGLPLKFANSTQDQDLPGAVTLGAFTLSAPAGTDPAVDPD